MGIKRPMPHSSRPDKKKYVALIETKQLDMGMDKKGNISEMLSSSIQQDYSIAWI